MAKDHFVPKAYLRGFTAEYLTGKKGGNIVVYNAAFGTCRRLSMNDYIACEPEFYDNHSIDKHWSQTIEQKWPSVRDALKNRETNSDILNQLFWFVAAQLMRTHAYMNHVARFLAFRDARKTRLANGGCHGTAVFMNMADTGEVMQYVQSRWPIARDALETDYAWKVYHNSFSRGFLTSDDPCQWNSGTEGVTVPLALDMALVGRITEENEKPSLVHANASTELVTQINRGVVRGCRSFVYAHEENQQLCRFVKRNHVLLDPMFAGRSFKNDPEPVSVDEIAKLLKRFQELRNRDKHHH